jgi:hypothetical protein
MYRKSHKRALSKDEGGRIIYNRMKAFESTGIRSVSLGGEDQQ